MNEVAAAAAAAAEITHASVYSRFREIPRAFDHPGLIKLVYDLDTRIVFHTKKKTPVN